MQRELKGLHLGDYRQEVYRRTHVVDPSDAGLVFFKMATAYDELQDTKNALRCCKLYLNVCRQMGDVIGEALACNNIGVQLQVIHPSVVGPSHMYQNLGGRRNLQKAVSYHSLHLQNGDDLGRFIAYVNLGQVYRDMDMMAQSRESALKVLLQVHAGLNILFFCRPLNVPVKHTQPLVNPLLVHSLGQPWLLLEIPAQAKNSSLSTWSCLVLCKMQRGN